MNILAAKPLIVSLSAVALLALGLGYGMQTLMPSGQPGRGSQTGISFLGGNQEAEINRPGKVSVVFDKETVAVGENLEAKIMIDTGEAAIQGFDIVLSYNPEEWALLNPQVTLAESEVFSQFPLNTVDPVNGQIKLSGLADLESSFTGEMMVGFFLLQPLKAGRLTLEVFFKEAGSGIDTNLAETETGEDILGDVINGEIIVE